MAPELDASGDIVFRFKLDAPAPIDTLEAFYREAILDLLRVVRLYAGDRALIVDGFAFLNAPREVVRLLPPRGDDEPGTAG